MATRTTAQKHVEASETLNRLPHLAAPPVVHIRRSHVADGLVIAMVSCNTR